MNSWIAFWNILKKDMNTYYLKPPNISWGIVFPVAWTLMFYLRSSEPIAVRDLLPGIMALSVLFGTTSMLAVTITFERRSKSFERLLLAPISIDLLMGAKTAGAVVFGFINAFVPVVLALFWTNLAGIHWPVLAGAALLIALTSTFLGLFIAVSVKEVFEAQTFSNFFRFPMLFLCGLFIPISQLPWFLQPLSYMLPLTYGADMLQFAVAGESMLPLPVNFLMLLVFAVVLFIISTRNVKRRWIN